jgi:hypothetical protein
VLDAMLLPRTKPVKVTQNGVLYKGIRYGQYAPELIHWMGKEVLLAVDGRNLSNVQVWSLEDRFICVANSNRRVAANATDADLRKAIAEKRAHRKLQRDFYEMRPRMHEDTTELLARAAAARNAAKPPEPPIDPPSMVPFRTPIEGEMPALRRAIEDEKPLRKAAGAEGLSQGDLFRKMAEACKPPERREEPIEDPFDKLSERNNWGSFSYPSEFSPEDEEALERASAFQALRRVDVEPREEERISAFEALRRAQAREDETP